ncbi:SRPBCC family protein [Endozoicomonas sp. G2_2]|uniref:SRPBCC family protein n=1 Tax=Endozoicomonas sp. G2_2 TaxID=2821092 RepID=UPI001ADB35C3|nr:SRPBCC family protein [Endozoicomonas sp. G2_2]MBO9470648.1 SRPBCC family protein [Endozoicomonas sp. G2_2]
MQSLHVSRVFEADAATVFDVISDHAGYASLPGVRRAWLRRTGDAHRDGVNAERVLDLGLARIVERITEYEPGNVLGYRIIESPLPIEHAGARLTFEPLPGPTPRTRVHWRSQLRASTPLVQAPVAFAIARQMAFAYGVALRIWARRLR